MKNDEQRPGASPSHEHKIMHFVWSNLPRLAILALICLIVVLASVISGRKTLLEQEKANAQAQGRKPVNTVVFELRPTVIRDSINLPGAIEPWIRLELLAKVSGSIEEVLVTEGDEVNEGDVLARIEENDYRIALESARAAYTLAKADFERAKVMVSKKAMPEADLQSIEARLLTSRAGMENAELRLSRCAIRAPMNGIVSRLDAEVGLYLGIGDPVGQMLQIDRVKAVVGIPESDVDAVRKISGVDFTIKALDNRRMRGSKYFLAPTPETVARLYRLELEVDNQDGKLLPGMFLRANVIKNTKEDAVAVPLYSIISRGDEQFVFVAQDSVAAKRPVKLGIIEKWMVEITEGLSPGDHVIVEGHRDVENGQEIEVIKTITEPGDILL